jgi:hypothetical protein
MKIRFDKMVEIRSFKKTDEGYLEVVAPVAKVGVMTYLTSNGNKIIEYVPSYALFDSKSIDSLRLKPVTLTHPTDLLNSENFKENAVGYVSETVFEEGQFLVAKFLVTDKTAISHIETGLCTELSCGYEAEVEENEGETEDGIAYDTMQTYRKYNHLSLVNKARGGSELSIKLDGCDGFIITKQEDTNSMKKTIRIDGVDHELENDAIVNHIATLTKRTDSLETELSNEKKNSVTIKAKLDSVEAELSKVKSVNVDAEVAKRVDSRLALIAKAKPILGEELKMDSSDDEIKKAVILAIQPTAKFDGIDEKELPIYLNARFDACVELIPELNEAVQREEMFTRKDASDKKDAYQTRKDSLNSRWEK